MHDKGSIGILISSTLKVKTIIKNSQSQHGCNTCRTEVSSPVLNISIFVSLFNKSMHDAGSVGILIYSTLKVKTITMNTQSAARL